MSAGRYEVAIIGSGFAGTILARALHRLGRRVVVLERGRHPRFALGESSTPLANLALERLARRFRFDDLDRLAAYGRWLDSYPQVERGLKRGFTFYSHEFGKPFAPGPENDRRLLVAASPDDRSADSHWLRADVDAHLVQAARAEGVEILEEAEVLEVESAIPMRLLGRRGGERLEIVSDLVVDASGAVGVLATRLPIPAQNDRLPFRTDLVYGHFSGLRRFADCAPRLSPGPYPDDRAAVHHLFDGGWMYVLPFDRDLASAGFVLRTLGERSAAEKENPRAAQWDELLSRLPTVAAQFSDAKPQREIESVAGIRYRRKVATGPGWALLPHAYAFYDPLFSTGIAWSLLGVERLATLLAEVAPDRPLTPDLLAPALERYGRVLAAEADRIEELVDGAWEAMRHFALFVDYSLLYFAAVSWAETVQRLEPEGWEGVAPAWQGFLGVGDPLFDRAFPRAVARLRSPAEPAGREGRQDFSRWVAEVIAPRNIAGLADPARRNLYPADLDTVVERAALLGRSREEMLAAVPRLLRQAPPETAEKAPI